MAAHASSSSSLPPPLPQPAPLPPSLSPTLPSSSSSMSSPPASSVHPTPHSPEALRQIAEARSALAASMTNIGSSLDSSLRSRAQNLHDNSKQLEKQQKDVVKATEGLRKENEKLRKLADEGGRKVKELGNVQNWAEMLERDFLVLGETLRLADGGGESEGSWETGSEGSWEEEEGKGEESGERKMATTNSAQSQQGPQQLDEHMDDGGDHTTDSVPEPAVKTLEEHTSVDAEGDTHMNGTETEHQAEGDPRIDSITDIHPDNDKGKAKIEDVLRHPAAVEHEAENQGGSSTATTTTGTVPESSLSSVHTVASVPPI